MGRKFRVGAGAVLSKQPIVPPGRHSSQEYRGEASRNLQLPTRQGWCCREGSQPFGGAAGQPRLLCAAGPGWNAEFGTRSAPTRRTKDALMVGGTISPN